MSRFLFSVCAILFLVMFLSGCGSPRYVVVTEDYTVYIGRTQPLLDTASDNFKFTDENGDFLFVPRSTVKKVQEIN